MSIPTLAEHAAALYRVAKVYASCTCGWRVAIVDEKRVKVEVKCQRCRIVDAYEASPHFQEISGPLRKSL